MDLSSLDQFKASALLTDAISDAPALPRRVALALIDFDPQQPRRQLDADALQALADTIALHGVLEPVSLRSCLQAAGRFIVNRGERRVRASRIAGLVEIPAFVDERLDPYAQVIENEHREDLSLFDLATFVVEREAAGDSRAAIARRLGKSRSLITELASLKVAPASVQAACREGRISDSRSLYVLARATPAAASTVAEVLDGGGVLSRAAIERSIGRAVVRSSAAVDVGVATSPLRPAHRRSKAGRRDGPPTLVVELAGRQGRLLWQQLEASERGEVVFDDGARETVCLADLRLTGWAKENDR